MTTATNGHTIINLDDVEDVAPKFGFGDIQEARFANEALGCEQTGLAFFRVAPNQAQTFSHYHEHQEELYVVVAGSGRVQIDGEIHDVRQHDAIRVAPRSPRSFAAGPDGLTYVAFGTPALSNHENDGEFTDVEWN